MNRPDASDLLAIARRTLLETILPRLPEELHYSALMIANAMAIARREHDAGGADAEAELARLRRLFAQPAQPLAGAALHTAVEGYNRRLVAEIRAGRFDDGERGALLEHLHQTTAARLAVANPKALKD